MSRVAQLIHFESKEHEHGVSGASARSVAMFSSSKSPASPARAGASALGVTKKDVDRLIKDLASVSKIRILCVFSIIYLILL